VFRLHPEHIFNAWMLRKVSSFPGNKFNSQTLIVMQCFKNTLFIVLAATIFSCSDGGFNPDNLSNTTGQGGSMTRFAIKDNIMYVLGHSSIQVYDIAGAEFNNVKNVEVTSGMETIFADNDHLYLGANDAMYIYSIADPTNPEFVFRYSHIVSCDPVVVQDDRAYITMRGGTRCNMGSNALEVLDISDPMNPVLLQNVQMVSPYGLAVSNDVLLVCEGEFGLKVFEVNEGAPYVTPVDTLDTFHAYDVIVKSNTAIITGLDGIFQYTFSGNGGDMNLISTIPVDRKEL
jgi:hypothetical protein